MLASPMMFNGDSELSDTDPEVSEQIYKRLASMPPGEKLRRCMQLCQTVRTLVLAGIYARHPGASSEEVRKRFAALTLGEEFARQYLEWNVQKEGW